MIKFIIKRLLALIPVLVEYHCSYSLSLIWLLVILPRLLWVSRHVPKISSVPRGNGLK